MSTKIDPAGAIRRRLADAGIDAVVTVQDGGVWLEGSVQDEDARLAAEAIAAEVDPTLTVHNYLDILAVLPTPEELDIDMESDRLTGFLSGPDTDAVEEVRRQRAAANVASGAGATDDQTAEPYFPPTDPVVRTGPHGVEVLGGFAKTSAEQAAEEVQEAEATLVRGDEAIAEDVARDLAADAMTTDLDVKVYVRRGVVHLRGLVRTLDDADAAEEVAGRVSGVVEVREELEIAPG